jgi:hypothetical protein
LIPPVQNAAPPRKVGKLLRQQLPDKLINLIAFGIISIILQSLIQLTTYRKYKEKNQSEEMVGKIETPWITYFNLILIEILQQTKRKTPSELQGEKLKG